MPYNTPQNVKHAPDCADVMNDTVFIAQPEADQILLMIQAVAGHDYPLQWRLLNRIKIMFEHHFTWEDIRFIFILDTVCELRDEIKKSRGGSNSLTDQQA